jgi:hypothetical protein
MTNTQHFINAVVRAQSEDLIVIKGAHGFIVINQEGDIGYNIIVEDNEIVACDCPHATFRQIVCKHMVKSSLVKNINIKALSPTTKINVIMVG